VVKIFFISVFLSFSCILLSCAAKGSGNKREYYFQGKHEWKNIASDFRYPIELEEHIETFLGIPYLLGGDDENGIDCSGFVKKVYEIYGIDLPRYSVWQSKLGIEVPKYALLPGDLVFFGETENDSVSHVGIYMGENKFANATSSQGVKYSSLDEPFFYSRYLFAKRLRY